MREVLPAVLEVQANPGGDLSTSQLAATTGMSSSQFHKVFRAATGETVKQHTLRVRLERAALRMRMERTAVSTIAFDLGFNSHETFTRAFTRRFGVPPSEYRMSQIGPEQIGTRQAGLEAHAPAYPISPTMPVRLRPTHVAFVRHSGPYEDVDISTFERLTRWVTGRGLNARALCGIAHDAPGITPPHLLRFDVGVHVSESFRSTADVLYQFLPERWCAATTYVGPFSGLGDAYGKAFGAANRLRGFHLVGLPVEEVYSPSELLAGDRIQTTHIYLPLRRVRGA